MKNYLKISVFILFTTFFISCSDDVDNPTVEISADNLSPKVGDKVTFTVAGDAETLVIFTGDDTHEYIKSHLAITTGLNVDQELVVLLASNLTNIRNYLTPFVNNYNNTVGASQQLDIDAIMTNIATLVDKQYTNKLSAAYEMWLFMTPLNGVVTRNAVDLYYDDRSVLLAPTGGFSKGFSVNRYTKTLEHTYTQAGMYTVTLVATNLSDKQYSGSGYQDDRSSSADEYKYKRTFKEITITVQP